MLSLSQSSGEVMLLNLLGLWTGSFERLPCRLFSFPVPEPSPCMGSHRVAVHVYTAGCRDCRRAIEDCSVGRLIDVILGGRDEFLLT